MRNLICTILTGLSLMLLSGIAIAEEQKKPAGLPPMLVTTAEIVDGKSEPTATFVGTVYFSRTAEVAAEIEGIVRQVFKHGVNCLKTGSTSCMCNDRACIGYFFA